MNQISENQKRRALNIIWNAAKRYDFFPDFKAYDENGEAELYWNCIIGAVYRHYDYPKLASVFSAFQQYEDGDTYEGLFWLGLENCAYQKELPDRPVLERMRRSYAEQFVKVYSAQPLDDYRLYECLSYAHFLRVLGQEPVMNRYDKKLLDELEFSPSMTTEEIVQRAKELFAHWFQISTEERKRERHPFRLSLNRQMRGKGKRRYRKFGLGLAEHPDAFGSEGQQDPADTDGVRSRMTAEELREFMTGKYGKPLYPLHQTLEIERCLCTGDHAGCHLHFTKGEPMPERIQNGFEALQKEREAAQIERNKRYYQAALAANHMAVNKLCAKIQNSVLLHLQPSLVRSNTGALEGGRAWRAVELGDEKVFQRIEQGNMGDLSVDILLDASNSQKRRQEIVSSQGFMIAEALTRCGIPCRVMSFCSMTGYTILRIFRDYNETRSNGKIFEYVSNGCNRDGLAVRAAHYLIGQSSYEHKILIVLSDVKPNDIRKIRRQDDTYIPYEGDAGVSDTALEVRRARADGIAVICVFTGEDDDLPSAKLVYGRDFASIRSLDKLADAVGMLLQNQIRNL